jgi:two-component system, cell cycle sensor histidine kinase and response regulator CckA
MTDCSVALVVSADRQVRRLIAAGLDQIGCTAVDVATSQEGLTCAGRSQIDFLILDISLPGALEPDMVRHLRGEQPNLKVLYLLGPSNGVFDHSCAVGRIDAYLLKPFALHQLCDVVACWLNDEVVRATATGLSLN